MSLESGEGLTGRRTGVTGGLGKEARFVCWKAIRVWGVGAGGLGGATQGISLPQDEIELMEQLLLQGSLCQGASP